MIDNEYIPIQSSLNTTGEPVCTIFGTGYTGTATCTKIRERVILEL